MDVDVDVHISVIVRTDSRHQHIADLDDQPLMKAVEDVHLLEIRVHAGKWRAHGKPPATSYANCLTFFYSRPSSGNCTLTLRSAPSSIPGAAPMNCLSICFTF